MKSFATTTRWVAVAVMALAVSGQQLRGAVESVDELQKLVVPIGVRGRLSPDAEATQADLAKGLAEVSPRRKAEAKSLVTRDGRFVLYGDLFKTGGCFALLEMPIKTGHETQYDNGSYPALAEWTSSGWQLRGLWNIPVVWRPKGWKASEDDYMPATPATRPFELRDFDRDGIPEVTIAADVGKYYQGHYLLRFDSKTRGLTLLEYAMAKPELVGNFVRLSSNSGRQAIWGESEYLQWSGARLVSKAVWHDETPYNNNEHSFFIATVPHAHGRIDKYRITYVESDSDRERGYAITRNGQSFARLRIVWKDPNYLSRVEDTGRVEEAWLFEKLTGISRKYFPSGPEEIDANGSSVKPEPLVRLEKYATVRVTGDKGAVRMLSVR